MITDENASLETKDKNKTISCKCYFQPFKGYAFAVIAAANYCVGNIIVKLAKKLKPTDHLIILYGIQFVSMLGKIYSNK